MGEATAMSAGSAPDSCRTDRPVISDVERLGYLVRCAMEFMDSDLHAARRCLHDASTLLRPSSQEAGKAPLPTGFQSGGLARWQVRRTLAHIEANLASKMETRGLADVVSFSKSHFSRAFKRSLGVPPMAYVLARRVERAKLMMSTTREQLTDIALACGFADQSHLNRAFRRTVGMSPGLWRRTLADVLQADGRAADSTI
jgi:transcriptional regulator GlxA family with amidase domain